MKKLVSLVALGSILAGCGVAPTYTVSRSVDAKPRATALNLTPAPSAPAAPTPTPPAAPAPSSGLTETLAAAKELGQYGPLMSGFETLVAPGDERGAYGVQTTPQKTQEKADAAAREWASDSKQMWLGWGFKTFAFFGRSRHVYFSASKKRLLTIDFNFWGKKIGEYETTGLVTQYAGKLISKVLEEPRDAYAIDGADAYRIAKQAGFQMPTNGNIKVLLFQPMFFGPQWLFLNGENKPSVIVDAKTGEVSSGGLLLQLIGYIF